MTTVNQMTMTMNKLLIKNGIELLDKIEVKNISEYEYKIIRRTIGNEFGFGAVWYDEEDED